MDQIWEVIADLFEFKNQFIDYGMQTYYETGIQWADDIVKDSLGLMEIKYNKFEWPNHDISKSFQKMVKFQIQYFLKSI